MVTSHLSCRAYALHDGILLGPPSHHTHCLVASSVAVCPPQLFYSLNQLADQCRDKWDRRPVSSIATSSTTSTPIEESLRQHRLPPFTHNKLVFEINRSRTYAFREVEDKVENDERTRCFHVSEARMWAPSQMVVRRGCRWYFG